MITDYKRARKDAAFLVEWMNSRRRAASVDPSLEALAVMNPHDAINFFALVLMTGSELPKLPYDIAESDGVPETGA